MPGTNTENPQSPDLDDDSDNGTVFHPGEILHRDFLQPLSLSSNALAMALRIPPPRITELVRGRRGITADTALRLARYLGTTAEFWMALQASYDLAVAWGEQGARIESDITPRPLPEKSDRKHIAKMVKKRAGSFKDAL
jgi:addiction module HigA family antidote